jgi:rod shape-determining protein MreC
VMSHLRRPANPQPGRQAAYLLLGLIVLAMLLDLAQARARRAGEVLWLDSLLCAPAVPLQTAITATTHGIEHAWQAAAHGGDLREENVRLRERVGELEGKLLRLREEDAQARRERGLRASAPSGRPPGTVARVIGVGSGGWLSYLVVDAGSEQGVRVRDVALAAEGLVGQVYAITKHSARVLPITDPSSGVAALVQRTRERGVVKGTGAAQWSGVGAWRPAAQSAAQCELQYLPQEAQLRPGDLVLTSGMGRVFPKGLRIGTVVSVTRDPATVQEVAVVKPAVDFHRIEDVLLVRP